MPPVSGSAPVNKTLTAVNPATEGGEVGTVSLSLSHFHSLSDGRIPRNSLACSLSAFFSLSLSLLNTLHPSLLYLTVLKTTVSCEISKEMLVSVLTDASRSYQELPVRKHLKTERFQQLKYSN